MSSSVDLAVTMMIGTVELARIALQTSIPDSLGSITSRRTKSGLIGCESLERFDTVASDGDREPFPLKIHR